MSDFINFSSTSSILSPVHDSLSTNAGFKTGTKESILIAQAPQETQNKQDLLFVT